MMQVFALLAILFTTPAHAELARVLQFAPLENSIAFNKEQGKDSGCRVSLTEPMRAKVISETPTEFLVEWKTPLHGCFWQSLWGQDMKRGFVRKKDLIWDESLEEELPMIPFPKRPETASNPVECLDLGTQKFLPNQAKQMDIGDLIGFIRNQAGGIKPPNQIDLYQRCYPLNKNGFANYLKYRKFLPVAGEVFRVSGRKEPQEVNPSLLSCLFRRESGFDEHNSGATGIGQHTSVNIKEISGRLRKPGSWEGALWRKFFEQVKADPEGRAALASCMGSSKTGEPVFDTKEDALCPLQSIAAGSIYILMIQRELARTSKIMNVEWESELEYQTAIAAAYNLGEGAAGQAVKNLLVDDWVGAIRKKSTGAAIGKDCEVMLHINAVRNCLQSKNPWQPMYYTEKPVCQELKGMKIEQPMRPTCIAWSAMPKDKQPKVPSLLPSARNLPKRLPAEVKKPPTK